jgi:hypothetical protein
VSNHLLHKIHFDLIVDVAIHGPSDATDWGLEWMCTPDEIGRELLLANFRSTAWHRAWSVVHNSLRKNGLGPSDDSLMARASEYAAAVVDAPAVLADLFDPEDLAWVTDYCYQPRTPRLTCAQALDLLAIWDYNSSEHLTWIDPPVSLPHTSDAHHTVETIRDCVIDATPGVPEDGWNAYTDETHPFVQTVSPR